MGPYHFLHSSLAPYMAPFWARLQYSALDLIGHKKGRKPYFYWVYRPLLDYMKLVLGAGNRNRTYDLIITNDALYQLSYPGVVGNFKALAELGQFTVKLRSNYKPGAGCGSRIIGDMQTTITIADKSAPTNTNPPVPIAILSAVRTQCFPARHRAR